MLFKSRCARNVAVQGGLHIHLMLPETKGKKLIEIRKLFKAYTCQTGCRIYFCPCILNRQRVTLENVKDRKRAREIRAKHNAPPEVESSEDSSTDDDSDDFADVKSDIPSAVVVETYVESDDDDNDTNANGDHPEYSAVKSTEVAIAVHSDDTDDEASDNDNDEASDNDNDEASDNDDNAKDDKVDGDSDSQDDNNPHSEAV